jgi:hypothetical protein
MRRWPGGRGRTALALDESPPQLHKDDDRLASLRAAWNTGSALVWDIAVVQARHAGTDELIVLASADGTTSLAEGDALVLGAVDELSIHGRLRDGTRRALGDDRAARLRAIVERCRAIAERTESLPVGEERGPAMTPAPAEAGWLFGCLLEHSRAHARGS